MAVSETLVFDVNETLLDLSALDPHFERIFGDAGVRRVWFDQMIHSAMLGVITDNYHDFGTVAKGALSAVGNRTGVVLTDVDKGTILAGTRTLPPHPEVAEALSLLQNAGVRLAALTNSALEVAKAQLENAGLAGYFERILSADSVKRLKPAPEPYHHAAAELGVPTSEFRLVAAHGWDVAGALHVGAKAAFVARPGKNLDPLSPEPDIVGGDVLEVARTLLARAR
jgi:2-haloacid dehalogenase